MSDGTQIGIDETPVNPYSLLEAVNRSSDTAHMGWLIFLGIMAYLAFMFGFNLSRAVSKPRLTEG